LAAKKLGVHESTFEDYKKRYPEFSEAIKKGKVVNSILPESFFIALFRCNFRKTNPYLS